MPVIAFSNDSTVAGRGVNLLSFLPKSEVNRIVDYAAGTGKRSFAALVPDNAYGGVAEAAFKQAVARRGGRIVAFEKYGADRSQIQGPARTVAQALGGADTLFLPDDGEALPQVAQALTAAGVKYQTHPAHRHRPVGSPAGVQRCRADGRALCRAQTGWVPCFRGALPHPFRAGAGAHGDALLRCGGAGCGAGQDTRRAAFRARDARQSIRLCRH